MVIIKGMGTDDHVESMYRMKRAYETELLGTSFEGLEDSNYGL